MVEVVGVILAFVFVFFIIGGIIVTWNIAKGGIDIAEFFSGRRGAGYSKNSITGEGATREKIENPKWGKDGKVS